MGFNNLFSFRNTIKPESPKFAKRNLSDKDPMQHVLDPVIVVFFEASTIISFGVLSILGFLLFITFSILRYYTEVLLAKTLTI